jgi:hypothetical protein
VRSICYTGIQLVPARLTELSSIETASNIVMNAHCRPDPIGEEVRSSLFTWIAESDEALRTSRMSFGLKKKKSKNVEIGRVPIPTFIIETPWRC